MHKVYPAALLVLLLNPAPAIADIDPFSLPEDWHGFYIGAGPGYANVYSWDDDDDNDGDEYDFANDYGNGDLGFIISGGFRFNPFMAVELAYADAGTPDWDDSNVFINDLNGTFDVDAKIDITSYQLTGLGILPFARVWEIYLRGGIAVWDADSNKTLTPLTGGEIVREQEADDGVDLLLGIGIGRIIRDRWHLRLDYSSYRIDDNLMELPRGDDANTDMWSLQLLYRFGVTPDGIKVGDRLEYPAGT